ncbi:hypothetical protein GLOIN_2v1782618 [Rhizophagus irregularis DAOM 181602=DAOM 197198]|uniref:DNA polymerase delta catalytic subunit n=1 Tax=Rhizophagus irregularis (strain DAOM 181602 / DAOM 197198 / MUCL 43194) TaxID=747089 RepID=A0A2P4PH58_RHIID|nr:hypothetical protein GLOIN_2v1782618 [Rhizophagus irregularis DAOM 181602=DAOM 197198]POG64677.1 hypothetical protein GLOIN_2v1782618 [Rhizophagus irregularis DAOM 181602=DAOM 197198]|eukprot:XP_025171543.1 hypothetical protein GLOIN_2v1782618 [Rhizophagus irregularis DAOM 181602=DAOM 197198]
MKKIFYNGSVLPGIPSRELLVKELARLKKKLTSGKGGLSNGSPLLFMPIDIEDRDEGPKNEKQYVLRMYGPLEDGTKVCVKVTGILPYFDIRVPDDEENHVGCLNQIIELFLAKARVYGKEDRTEQIFAHPIRGYHTSPKPYIRVYTKTLGLRMRAMGLLKELSLKEIHEMQKTLETQGNAEELIESILNGIKASIAKQNKHRASSLFSRLSPEALKKLRKELGPKLELASDDSRYYRKVARENKLPIAGWVIIEKYENVKKGLSNIQSESVLTRCRYLLKAPLASIKAAPESNTVELTDPTLIFTWDIETYTPRGRGHLPTAVYPEDRIFMIGITVHWKDDPTPVRQLCITTMRGIPADDHWTTIICDNEKNLLRAFALCWEELAPDIQLGFNDSCYDWKTNDDIELWVQTMDHAGDERVSKIHNDEEEIKISPEETFRSSFLKIPGCILLDLCGLPSKTDMPINRMWQLYEEAVNATTPIEEMRKVAEYCITDALRCQQLMLHHNVVGDYREVAIISAARLADATEMIERHVPSRQKGEGVPGEHNRPSRKWGCDPHPGLRCGVTAAGQEHIKSVAQFLKDKKYRIKYGDTDSLYIVSPEESYDNCDKDFTEGRISLKEYWTEMVRVTMRIMPPLCKEINAFIQETNQTSFLKMAYEEVLFPAVFLAKKKYFGIAHVEIPNFSPKELFVKGVDIVKQGQSELFRDIGNRIMWAAVSVPESTTQKKTLLHIVEDVLKDAIEHTSPTDHERFVQTSTYKKHKDNKSVKQFIERMKARRLSASAENEGNDSDLPSETFLYEIPESGDRFQYVITKPQFQPQIGGTSSPNFSEKQVDEYSQKAAKKYLEDYIKGLTQNSLSSLTRKRMYTYIYENSMREARLTLFEKFGIVVADTLHRPWLNFGNIVTEDYTSEEKCRQNITSLTDAFVQSLCSKIPEDWNKSVIYSAGLVVDPFTGKTICGHTDPVV